MASECCPCGSAAQQLARPSRCFIVAAAFLLLQAVEEFEALVAQVRKNTASLERILGQIATGPLVPPDPASSTAAGAGVSTCGVGSAAGAGGAAGDNGAASCADGADSGSGAASAPQPEMEPGSAPGAPAPEARVPDMQEASEEYEQYRLEVRG